MSPIVVLTTPLAPPMWPPQLTKPVKLLATQITRTRSIIQTLTPSEEDCGCLSGLPNDSSPIHIVHPSPPTPSPPPPPRPLSTPAKFPSPDHLPSPELTKFSYPGIQSPELHPPIKSSSEAAMATVSSGSKITWDSKTSVSPQGQWEEEGRRGIFSDEGECDGTRGGGEGMWDVGGVIWCAHRSVLSVVGYSGQFTTLEVGRHSHTYSCYIASENESSIGRRY